MISDEFLKISQSQFEKEYLGDWNYKDTYNLKQGQLLTHIVDKEVCIKDVYENYVVIWSFGTLIQIPIHTWLEGSQYMLRTLCKERLKGNYDHVWRTLETVKSGRPIQWAKMPVHHECKERVEMEVMKSRIGIAAGLDCYNYALEKPSNVDERPINPNTRLRERGY